MMPTFGHSRPSSGRKGQVYACAVSAISLSIRLPQFNKCKNNKVAFDWKFVPVQGRKI